MKNLFKPCMTFFLITALLQACSRPPDEERIRASVSNAVEAAEAKDVKALMRFISKEYADDRGNDYNGVKGILVYQLLRPEPVKVFLRGLSIEVKGDAALVDAKAITMRGRNIKSLSDIVPDEAEAYRFSILFKNESGDWKVRSASWEPIGLAGLL
ncbi:MAG: hypothetical protein A2X93_05880 [Deltaproteobacteria bacterium GWC2_56_8]|nr:MAG: hypothetical protein A2X93_05880 [Deltaproteobacteria bacterium GWC2_56_8]